MKNALIVRDGNTVTVKTASKKIRHTFTARNASMLAYRFAQQARATLYKQGYNVTIKSN